MRSLRGSPACPTETIGNPRDRTVPFDYVARVELTGPPKNRVEVEVPINVEGGFVATALGYGLAVSELTIRVRETAARLGLVTSNKIDLSLASTSDLSSKRFDRWDSNPPELFAHRVSG